MTISWPSRARAAPRCSGGTLDFYSNQLLNGWQIVVIVRSENGKTFVQVVGNMVPASKPITGIIVGILGLVTTVTAAMRGKKHKKRADNYSESIEAARMEGSDKGKINVSDLEKALDKDTKAHYNSTGTTRF
ncbi:MAG: hypothetical protein IIB37_12240 [Gemmatimonadetes bacterium]|nr:hypothetical protein [Gemmatimonadota bacterium]